eukprot:950754_1
MVLGSLSVRFAPYIMSSEIQIWSNIKDGHFDYFFACIASMLYRMWYLVFALFGYCVPSTSVLYANGSCKDYLRWLDGFNAWWFWIGGELLLEFVIFSKELCEQNEYKMKIRNMIMNGVSVIVFALMISPWIAIAMEYDEYY